MRRDIELGCRCGQVHGWLRDASPQTVHRIVCYCDDCQAFLHRLDRADLLDAHGGTDAVQVAAHALSFDRGTDRIVAMRLSAKGLYRWFSSCCHTPLGGSIGRPMPIIGGISVELLQGAADVAGKPRGALYGKYAVGGVAPGLANFGAVARGRYLQMILGWNRGGQRWRTWPNPFFDEKTRAFKYSTP